MTSFLAYNYGYSKISEAVSCYSIICYSIVETFINFNINSLKICVHKKYFKYKKMDDVGVEKDRRFGWIVL